VKHVEEGVLDFDDLGCGQALGPGVLVDVAADCGDWSDGSQSLENIRGADVAGVDDAVRAAKSVERLGPQEAVRIGDQADDEAVGH
jgi:hypothetical protein